MNLLKIYALFGGLWGCVSVFFQMIIVDYMPYIPGSYSSLAMHIPLWIVAFPAASAYWGLERYFPWFIQSAFGDSLAAFAVYALISVFVGAIFGIAAYALRNDKSIDRGLMEVEYFGGKAIAG